MYPRLLPVTISTGNIAWNISSTGIQCGGYLYLAVSNINTEFVSLSNAATGLKWPPPNCPTASLEYDIAINSFGTSSLEPWSLACLPPVHTLSRLWTNFSKCSAELSGRTRVAIAPLHSAKWINSSKVVPRPFTPYLEMQKPNQSSVFHRQIVFFHLHRGSILKAFKMVANVLIPQ